jgi:hypothetical protein
VPMSTASAVHKSGAEATLVPRDMTAASRDERVNALPLSLIAGRAGLNLAS